MEDIVAFRTGANAKRRNSERDGPSYCPPGLAKFAMVLHSRRSKAGRATGRLSYRGRVTRRWWIGASLPFLHPHQLGPVHYKVPGASFSPTGVRQSLWRAREKVGDAAGGLEAVNRQPNRSQPIRLPVGRIPHPDTNAQPNSIGMQRSGSDYPWMKLSRAPRWRSTFWSLPGFCSVILVLHHRRMRFERPDL